MMRPLPSEIPGELPPIVADVTSEREPAASPRRYTLKY
jgi:hypothetical protein